MKITKRQKVTAAQSIKAGSSLNDMLNAFEDKLAELDVNSRTKVECTINPDKVVNVFDEDYNEKYIDSNGFFGIIGEEVSLGEAKDYWNEACDDDPSLADYSDFESWWNDTYCYII